MAKHKSVQSRFGKLRSPNSVAELTDLIIESHGDEDNLVWMWRGQANIDWRVDSAAFRRLSVGGKTPTDRELAWYEKGLLKRATHRGFHINNGVVLGDFDLLARLQHHGAATRLLDASRNAFVGAFFACNSHREKAGVLLGFNAYHLGGYEGEPKTEVYDHVVKDLEKYEHPQTWEPPLVSPRIAAQHSQFLYSAISQSDLGSLRISSQTDAFVGIAIAAEMKPTFRKYLSQAFDIRTETMFPDIDGFGIANRFDIATSDSYRW